MGRDETDPHRREFGDISTHTPSWGVTGICGGVDGVAGISTHTPSWGVTGIEHVLYRDGGISTQDRKSVCRERVYLTV